MPNDQPKRGSWCVWMAVALALPALYVLSSGPTFWLVLMMADGGRLTTTAPELGWWVWFYQPLEWLTESSPLLRGSVRWYLGLFDFR